MGQCLGGNQTDLDFLRNYNGRVDVCVDKPHPSVAFTITPGRYPCLEHRNMKLGWENNDALNYYGYWDNKRRFRLSIRSLKRDNEATQYRTFRTIQPPKYMVTLSFATATPKSLADLDYKDASTYYIYSI